jgi:hypothetical protein
MFPMNHQPGKTNHPGTLSDFPSLRAEADEKIRQFESRFDLLQYQLHGWCVWAIFRFTIYSRLEKLQGKKWINPVPFSKAQRLKLSLKDLIRLSLIPHSDLLVYVQSSNRSELVGDKYKDIYFDDLLSQTSSFVKIENLVNRHYLMRSRQALIPSQITTSAAQLWVAGLLRLPISEEINAISQELSQLIQNELGLAEVTPRWVATRLANFQWSIEFYKWMINRIQPDYLLMTTTYTYHAIIAAAKEAHVEVIEFQHGMVDHTHNGYSWSDYALPYIEKMPIPDKIFVYGDYWKEQLSQRGFWGERLVSVGSLRMDQYRLCEVFPQPDTTTLVVTTQNVDIQPLIDFFARFAWLADSLAYKLIFKLHPGENDKSRYAVSFADNPKVQILLGSENPSTYQLIASANFHLSIYSTCHFESLALGVPTIILPFSNHELVLNLTASGYAYYVDSPEDLFQTIQEHPHVRVPESVGERYFKPDALNNIRQALKV